MKFSMDERGGFQKTRKPERKRHDEVPQKSKSKSKKKDWSKQRDVKRCEIYSS